MLKLRLVAHSKSMDISNIYVHDARLHRVIEDIEDCTVTMEVELPILERGEALEPRRLVFDDAYNYQVIERPWDGLVTILNMLVIGKQGRWHHVRIETNAGCGETFCAGIRVCNYENVGWHPSSRYIPRTWLPPLNML
jgi:hypothetical protein